MQILSIQIGLPRTVEYRGQNVTTGIFKDPVQGPVKLGFLNIEGDGQADLKVHGGKEKALYSYSQDAYTAWKELRPQDEYPYGAMGENLTIDVLREDQIFVGDTYAVGSARIQACQPRFPCMKLGVKFSDPGVLKQFNEIGRPGVYYRVLEEGVIEAGDRLDLIDREATQVSIQELFEIKKPADDFARVHEILRVNALSANWRTKLESWI